MTEIKQKIKTTEFGQIPYEWNIVPFADVIDFQEGPGILAKDFRESGVPLIRLAGLTETANLLDGCNYLDPDMVKKRWHHFHVLAGDVLLSTSASLGRTAIVNKKAEGALVYTGIIRMRPVEKKIDNKFIFYFLQSPYFQEQVLAMGVGSVMKHFGPSHLRLMKVLLPPLPEQRAIAAVLSSFDDKIELLRSQNQTLETLAQALFKEWFVDFNFPNAQGKPYKKNGGKMMESELGEIPNDWKTGKLGEITDIKGGTTPSTTNPDFWNGNIYWTSPKDLADFKGIFLNDTQSKITPSGLEQIGSGLLPIGTVLLSSRAPIGYLAITAVPLAINQGYIAILLRKDYRNYFVYLWLKKNMKHIVAAANGSTFLEISKSAFKNINIVIPHENVAINFSKLVEPIFRKIFNNEAQIKDLSILRDNLLPKLINGTINVKSLI